mgnify:CR=1 FL=1
MDNTDIKTTTYFQIAVKVLATSSDAYPSPNTATILSFLYSTIVALALTTGLRNLLAPTGQISRSFTEIPLSEFLLFCTFIVVVIPFYHGAVWALVRSYKQDVAARKGGLMVITFAAMLLEASLFYAMGTSIGSLHNFVFYFGGLMLLDSTWVAFAHAAGATNREAPRIWAPINLSTLVFLVIYWNFMDLSLARHALLFVAAAVRTVFDYYLTRGYYLPELA